LDESILGEKILKEALKAPFRRLVENGGYDGGEKLAEWNTTDKNNVGYEVIKGVFVDMIAVGIVDPSDVPMTAVATAVSVAVALSSLGAAVVIKNDK